MFTHTTLIQLFYLHVVINKLTAFVLFFSSTHTFSDFAIEQQVVVKIYNRTMCS